ncbi:hypothetical protein GP475_02345 [Corynebacterium poyangense]|uniref:Uncharacterized protein n=1 Tax=Corynebacterium poyangense TaxID=2684405 RepID=A0A7H0SM28_9CORY|nr:hypothetical protein [Corynebacterium poyangense]QNQ89603.1 hypothetical protein GP475_02345 [Corynebacterium poyangense]
MDNPTPARADFALDQALSLLLFAPITLTSAAAIIVHFNPPRNGLYYHYAPWLYGEPLAFTPLAAQILILAGILTRITRRLTTKYPHIPPYTARVLFFLLWIAWGLYAQGGFFRTAILIFAIILGATACIPWTKIPPLTHLKHPNPQESEGQNRVIYLSCSAVFALPLAVFVFIVISYYFLDSSIYSLITFVTFYPTGVILWLMLVAYSARLRWRTGLYAVGASLIGCGILWAASFEYHDQGITFQKFPYLDSYLTFIATVLSAFLVGRTNWKKLFRINHATQK